MIQLLTLCILVIQFRVIRLFELNLSFSWKLPFVISSMGQSCPLCTHAGMSTSHFTETSSQIFSVFYDNKLAIKNNCSTQAVINSKSSFNRKSILTRTQKFIEIHGKNSILIFLQAFSVFSWNRVRKNSLVMCFQQILLFQILCVIISNKSLETLKIRKR